MFGKSDTIKAKIQVGPPLSHTSSQKLIVAHLANLRAISLHSQKQKEYIENSKSQLSCRASSTIVNLDVTYGPNNP